MEENLKKFKNELFYYALKLTGNKADAEDLLHDTFLKALIHKDKFSGNGIRAWLYAIMRNHFFNMNRKNKMQSSLFGDLEYYIIPDKSGETPDSIVSEKNIMKLIDDLGDIFKDPFKLHLYGYKSAEIAGKMNLNANTVRSRIYYARAKLSKELRRWA